MKISELSQRSGISIATIKYYQREGLLQPGELSRPNQASYSEEHLQRLLTIRALRDIAQLKVAEIRKAMQAIDRPGADVAQTIGAVREVIAVAGDDAGQPGPTVDPETKAEVFAFLTGLGWRIDARSSVVRRLGEVLIALRTTIGADLPVDAFEPYARAIEPIAEMEIGYFRRDLTDGSAVQAVQVAVTGTILWEHVLTTLRLAAHEHFLGR